VGRNCAAAGPIWRRSISLTPTLFTTHRMLTEKIKRHLKVTHRIPFITLNKRRGCKKDKKLTTKTCSTGYPFLKKVHFYLF
jgi:hypothetical protein